MGGTLRYGSCGRDVQRLQQFLNKYLHHFPPLPVNGRYGRRTEAAVRLYQTSAGLRVDGVAGPETWRALEKGLVGHQRQLSPMPKGFPGAPWIAIAIRAVEGGAEAPDHLSQGSMRHVTEGPVCPHAPVTHPVPARGDPQWMAVATREKGQEEVSGPAANPRILEYHATTTLKARSDEIPWCSSFANWCMQQAGIAGTKSAAAISWMHWGKPSAAIPGAITIIHNRKAAGSRLTASGYHVGFLVEEGPSHYRLLGGNQHNRVQYSNFSKASWQLVGYRWPSP
jgi:uncharacterized protein (TIGR02594 family)